MATNNINMKAVIPVAGAGTRLRPHTFTQPKPLIPVAGKPIIAFIIDQLIDVGITDFVFIIGYLGEKIEEYVHSHYPGLKTTFVQQNVRMGLGHAIWTAREALSDADEMFIVLGDTIFDANVKEMLNFKGSCLGLKKVEDPRKFGVAELDSKGFVTSVVEKPRIPKSNLAIVGLYKIAEVKELIEILDYNITNNIRTVNEFQLTDGLMGMLQRGIPIGHFTVSSWFDCGRKEILLETNAMLLKRHGTENFTDQEGLENTIIIPPVYIGHNCQLKNTIIGPNVTIGDNSQIQYSILKDSIIGSDTTLDNVVLQNSVVGSDAAIKGINHSLNIGDNTEIDMS
jgi:glucose-1-phosphate thymidylyltransferase